MAQPSPSSDRQSRFKLVILVPLTASQQDRLRQRFPEVDLVLPAAVGRSDAVRDADAVVAWTLSSDEIAGASRLRWMHTGGAGVDARLLGELNARGVAITNNSGVHAANIGEHVLGMMLTFARQLHTLVQHQTLHEWHDDDIRDKVFELSGQRLLVVGTGDIGQAVALRAAPFGMAVTGIRRRSSLPSPEGFSDVLSLDDLERAVASANHVVICLPLTGQTRQLFDARMIDYCQDGAFIYNVGRGEIVDTEALVAALRSGKLSGAGLDVVDPEPLPGDSPLWDMPNVLLTAHTSGATPRYWDRGLELVETNLRAVLDGTPFVNLVDPVQGY